MSGQIELGTKEFYQAKIDHNLLRIEKVNKAMKQVLKLNNDMCFSEINSAVGQLDLVISKLKAENKRCKELIEELEKKEAEKP